MAGTCCGAAPGAAGTRPRAALSRPFACPKPRHSFFETRPVPRHRTRATEVPVAEPADVRIGFLGLGIMGKPMVRGGGAELGRGCMRGLWE